ncbi:MAG: redoxin domain-containing protein [bacterium]
MTSTRLFPGRFFSNLKHSRNIVPRSAVARFGIAVSLAFSGFAAAHADTKPTAPVLMTHVAGVDGQIIELTRQPGQALAVVFYSTQCPIANACSEEIGRLASSLPAEKIKFLGVCVDPDIDSAEVISHKREFQLNIPVVHDRGGALVRKFRAKMTPEAFVLDDNGRVVYQGRIDDRYVNRPQKNPNPKSRDLANALTAIVEGRNIAVACTEAIGCPIPEIKVEAERPSPTYAREISRIIQKKCQECHSKGQVGPFPLETYEHARKRATDLADVTGDRLMPPWKAEPGFGQKFKNDHSLSIEEIEAFQAWADAGAPLGDISEMPAPVSFPTGWKLGTPDVVLEIPEAFEIPATGPDLYRCFVLPTNLPKDMYISKIEYMPDNRVVSHHMLAWVDISGEGRLKDAAEPGPGYISFVGPNVKIHGSLSGWAAGKQPTVTPEGVGISLPRNADVILQMHYHPSGKKERDRSKIGLHFSRTPVKATAHVVAVSNKSFTIPAGASNHEVRAELTIPADVVAFAFTPHQHLIGKEFTMTATFPDGRTENLIRIPRWDFNWQTTYELEKPMDLPKGTLVKLVATFDNSAGNPFNPNHPPREVKWGPQTTDEMAIGFITMYKKGQDLTRPGEKDDLNSLILEAIADRENKARASIGGK